MTLFAGYLNRDPATPHSDELCEDFARRLDRSNRSEPQTTRVGGLFLAHLDIGAFAGKAVRIEGGSIAALAGEPLFDTSRSGSREADLQRLHDSWRQDRLEDSLQLAHGVYSAVLYDAERHELVLITDNLGVRPVFIAETEERIYFSSALRILEEVSAVPKRMDLAAVAEVSAFGYSLGKGTGYSTISILREGELAKSEGGQPIECRAYSRWDDIETSDSAEEHLLQQVYAAFEAAIRRRMSGGDSAAAFLSGGLDSRAVVGVLSSLGLNLATYNFSITGSKDAAYGRRFAAHLGTAHHQVDLPPGRPEWHQIMANQLHPHDHESSITAPQGRVAWSGDGGSVGLGHVYITSDVVETLREGTPADGAQMIVGKGKVAAPKRILQPRAESLLDSALLDGVTRELARLRPDDPGRSALLFYLLNDQRRHLAVHFENLDRSRLEMQLPFLDSGFLRTVLRVPLDRLLRHAFYVRMLDLFPCDMKAVTWQAYPGHVPAPPDDDDADGGKDQWLDSRPAEWKLHERQDELAAGAGLLSMHPFPDPLLRKGTLRLALFAHRLRLRKVGYLFKAARTYARYWSISAGKVDWSGATLTADDSTVAPR